MPRNSEPEPETIAQYADAVERAAGPRYSTAPTALERNAARRSDPVVWHGDRSEYMRGCRCDECKRAQREYMRRYRRGAS